MTVSIVQSMPIAEAQQSIPLLPELFSWCLNNLPTGQAVAVLVPEADRPQSLGVDGELLLLVLPDDLQEMLPELALRDFDVYNRDSDDLLSRQTLLALTGERVWVEVDAWGLDGFPSGAVQTGKFYVGLVAAGQFVLSLHDYGHEDMEAFLGGVQGACGSSGPNYRPYRVWSEEELDEAAKGAVRPCDPMWPEPDRRVGCRVLCVR
jgi:hypothetical protein